MASATQLEFEKPIAELERQIDELKRTAGDSQLNVAEAIEPLERKLTGSARRGLPESHAIPAGAGRAQPASVRSRGLYPPRVHRFHRASWRSRVPRRCSDHRRMGASRRRDRDGDRPSAWARHQGEAEAQLRDAASRGISEGAPTDEARREVPRSRSHLHRHARAPGPGSARRSAGNPKRSRATCTR